MRLGRQSRGFTLLELVLVIVLLGILAATAIPRFLNISGDARLEVMRSSLAALRSANQMIHAKAVVEGKQKQITSSVVVDGDTINLRYGYPLGADLDAHLLTLPDDYFVFGGGIIYYFYPSGVANPGQCLAAYIAPFTPNNEPFYVDLISNCD